MDEVFYTLPEDLKPFVLERYEDGSEYNIGCKIINGNRVIFVVKIHLAMYNLVLCSRIHLGIYDEVYQYFTAKDALRAMEGWNEVGQEPDGWYRNRQTGKRREYHEDGSLKREWYQP